MTAPSNGVGSHGAPPPGYNTTHGREYLRLLGDMYFQPDDRLFELRCRQYLHPQMEAECNEEGYNREGFIEHVRELRASANLVLISYVEQPCLPSSSPEELSCKFEILYEAHSPDGRVEIFKMRTVGMLRQSSSGYHVLSSHEDITLPPTPPSQLDHEPPSP